MANPVNPRGSGLFNETQKKEKSSKVNSEMISGSIRNTDADTDHYVNKERLKQQKESVALKNCNITIPSTNKKKFFFNQIKKLKKQVSSLNTALKGDNIEYIEEFQKIQKLFAELKNIYTEKEDRAYIDEISAVNIDDMDKKIIEQITKGLDTKLDKIFKKKVNYPEARSNFQKALEWLATKFRAIFGFSPNKEKYTNLDEDYNSTETIDHSAETIGHSAEVMNTKFISAARFGDIQQVESLIKDIDINALDVDGNTALMYAATFISVEITQLLLDKHADVNIKNNNGLTVLDIINNDMAVHKGVNENKYNDLVKIKNMLFPVASIAEDKQKKPIEVATTISNKEPTSTLAPAELPKTQTPELQNADANKEPSTPATAELQKSVETQPEPVKQDELNKGEKIKTPEKLKKERLAIRQKKTKLSTQLKEAKIKLSSLEQRIAEDIHLYENRTRLTELKNKEQQAKKELASLSKKEQNNKAIKAQKSKLEIASKNYIKQQKHYDNLLKQYNENKQLIKVNGHITELTQQLTAITE